MKREREKERKRKRSFSFLSQPHKEVWGVAASERARITKLVPEQTNRPMMVKYTTQFNVLCMLARFGF